METRIYLNKGYRNIRPTDMVKTTRAVHSFCVYNGLRDSLFKSQGGYYKLCLDGILVYVCRTLDSITFEQLFNKLKD